jgi:hypothetical protein
VRWRKIVAIGVGSLALLCAGCGSQAKADPYKSVAQLAYALGCTPTGSTQSPPTTSLGVPYAIANGWEWCMASSNYQFAIADIAPQHPAATAGGGAGELRYDAQRLAITKNETVIAATGHDWVWVVALPSEFGATAPAAPPIAKLLGGSVYRP